MTAKEYAAQVEIPDNIFDSTEMALVRSLLAVAFVEGTIQAVRETIRELGPVRSLPRAVAS